MNKYIDHLTVNEYETVNRLLKKLEPIENTNMRETGFKKDYIELRCLMIKIDNIVKKYKRKKVQKI
jgi:hypothetical protein